MMFSFSVTALLAGLVCIWSFVQLAGLKRNIAHAKASGIPYVVVPFSVASPAGILFSQLIGCIPKGLKGWWCEVVESLELLRGWHYGSKPFKLMDTSSFLTVSPGSLVLQTSDPDVSAHFLRSSSVGKPHKLLDMLNIYGPTMTGTDGAETRLYRRTTAPFFNDHTMRRVWAESYRSAGVLMRLLGNTDPSKALDGEGIRAAVARSTLHVVSSVCFKKTIATDSTLLETFRGQEKAPAGWRLGFSKAMHGVLETFTVIYVTPKLLLKYSPLQIHQEARLSYEEFGKYMHHLKDTSEDRLRQNKDVQVQNTDSVLDLLTQAGIASPTPVLKPEEVLGNIFIFLFAGHEANANTTTFLFYLLACYPKIQQKAQAEIDRIFSEHKSTGKRTDSASDDTSGSSPYDWAYNSLMEGYVGACINEALRLYTVLPVLVKEVPVQPLGSQPGVEEGHVFQANGTSHRLPGGTVVVINTTALHTDPASWPGKPVDSTSEKSSYRPNPVELFNPEFWLSREPEADQAGSESPSSRSFLRPKPGTFVPFSEGSRGCLGKRFALVELCAVVTSVLSEYTVELVADDHSQWKKARDYATKALSEEIECSVSLRLTGNIPIRFVKRGTEAILHK